MMSLSLLAIVDDGPKDGLVPASQCTGLRNSDMI